MRILPALLVIITTSTRAVSGINAADEARECTAADHADGKCILPDESNEYDSFDEGEDEYYQSSSDDGEGMEEGEYGDDDDDDDYDDVDVDKIVDDGKCRDDGDDCAAHARDGGCEENPGYMTHRCAASCGTCDAVAGAAGGTFGKGPPCTDDNYGCADWSGQGECDANPGYMKKSCRRSCFLCFESTNQFGIPQRLPPAKEAGRSAHEKTIALTNKSVQYMQTVWTDEKFERVRHKCKNQHADCTFWAAIGECEKNSKFMGTNCAPPCETCDLLDIRHRCPIEPGNEVIWKPGDLNAMMEAIVDDPDGSGEFEKYSPRALSRPMVRRDGTPAEGVEHDGPWVVLLEGFVTEEEADRLVEIGAQQGYERSADVGKEKPDGTHDSLVSESRTSHNTWCQEPKCYEDPVVAPIVERIAHATRTEVRNSEYLQLLQYEPGQYYKQHHDYIAYHRDMPCGVRILTLFIYLNDVEDGGGTNFPFLNITVQPRKGSVVLWPSVLDEEPESKDGRTEHEALPVLSGFKYGANAWIHSRDFKASFAKGCN